MSRFEGRAEVAAKIDYEGGIADALDYGLKYTDMPEGDDELRQAWQAMEEAYDTFDAKARQVEALLPDDPEF